MIRLEQLSFSYPGAKCPALSNVSLSAAPGDLLCLAGENGSGKSTLLMLLAGLYRAGSGRMQVGPHLWPGNENRFRETAVLAMQDPDVQILGSTVEEDLLLGCDPRDKLARARALELAARFGLDSLLERPVQALSQGQKRKLCLAAALHAAGDAQEPRVLLLDEPFSGLDYPSSLEMRRVLSDNKAAGHTQVVTAHDLEPLLDLTDTLAVLQAGRLVLFGTPRELLDKVAEYGVRQPCSWRSGRVIEPW